MAETDTTRRFDGRAAKYAKYRPDYPDTAVDYIAERTRGDTIADIGSGTGKLTKLLLERGFEVFAVEPNGEMRAQAESGLLGFPRFHSVAATAENTGLPSGSVDAITVATAFHWFDHELCKNEFERILKTDGYVLILRNERDAVTDFMREFMERVKRLRGANPWNAEQEWKTSDAAYGAFFGGKYVKTSFPWSRELTFEELLGLELSRSTSPDAKHPNYEPLRNAMREMFDRYSKNDTVTYRYRTDIICGSLR